MNLDRIFLLVYVICPFLAAVLPWPKSLRGGLFSLGSGLSLLRVLMLLLLGGHIVFAAAKVAVSGTLVNGYPLEIVLSLDAYRYGFLITAELCFLMAHWMSPPTARHGTLVRVLISLVQGFCSLLLMSNNAVVTGALLMLAGAVFFYLVRFSLSGETDETGISVSRRMYSLYFVLGLAMMGWGILEFGGKDLLFSRVSGSTQGALIWLVMLFLAVPVPPWSRWFGRAVELLPEGVTLAITVFVSVVTLKFANLFGLVYPDLQWKQKMAIYALGLLGCVFSVGGLFAAETRRKLLGSLPGFFLSLILVAVGVSKSNLVISAYFACLFLPVFTALVLYASEISVAGPLQKTFIAFLLAIAFGLPGTPVYFIFSGIGARSLDMGVAYTIVFGIVWFFYFGANVFACRRIFMDSSPPKAGGISALGSSPVPLAGFGLFMMAFLILATQIAWRVL
jgi:hypothetical protein